MVRVTGDLTQWIWYAVAVVWLVLAFRTKRTLVRSGGIARLAIVAVVLAIVVSRPLTGTSLHHHIWRPSPVESSIALALVVAGAAFALWSRFTIGTNWSGVVTLKQDHELMQSGPYHVVRHPIYTGLLTMGLGSSLQYDEVYGFLFLVLAAVMLAFKMRLEERLMMENFPDQYPQYRQHVKAIVPFVL
jgi:protein-S-isoprenylcysteine O-methyltransferase Ste14